MRDAVVARFGTRADGGGWIIAGLSEGGYCASMLALRHPDLYAAAGNFSGDDRLTDDGNPRKLFGGTWAEAHDQEHAHDSRALLEAWPTGKAGPALWFSAGRSDDVLPRLRHLHELAQRTGLATTLETPGGDHNFRVWRTSFADALPWLMSHISSDPTIPNAHFTGVVTSR